MLKTSPKLVGWSFHISKWNSLLAQISSSCAFDRSFLPSLEGQFEEAGLHRAVAKRWLSSALSLSLVLTFRGGQQRRKCVGRWIQD